MKKKVKVSSDGNLIKEKCLSENNLGVLKVFEKLACIWEELFGKTVAIPTRNWKKNEACEEVVLFETNPIIVCFHKDVATNLMELKRNPPLEK